MTLGKQKELIKDWFTKDRQIVFKNKKQVLEFLQFISVYDSRYENILENERYTNMKSCVWEYNEELYHHQLEWMDSDNYFSGEKIKYKDVQEYVKMRLKLLYMIFWTKKKGTIWNLKIFY